LVVVIEVDTVEPAVPVVASNLPGVVFEHLDNPPVLSVLPGRVRRSEPESCRGIAAAYSYLTLSKIMAIFLYVL
jgi:hypothetical protein